MDPRHVKVCAHRGASGTHPPNTSAAFDEAVRLGVEILEFDVRRTLDDRFVVIHDATVDATTDGSGAIADLTFDQIRSLDAGGGQQVPSLDEAMAYADRAMLNINTKPETPEDDDRLADVLLGYFRGGLSYDRAFVACHRAGHLQRLHSLDPNIRLCPLIEQDQSGYIDVALKIVPCRVLQPRNNVVTKELVTRAHELGLKVNPFYADEEAEMKRFIDCGVDGILTNYPARLIKLREAL